MCYDTSKLCFVANAGCFGVKYAAADIGDGRGRRTSNIYKICSSFARVLRLGVFFYFFIFFKFSAVPDAIQAANAVESLAFYVKVKV